MRFSTAHRSWHIFWLRGSLWHSYGRQWSYRSGVFGMGHTWHIGPICIMTQWYPKITQPTVDEDDYEAYLDLDSLRRGP